MQLTIQNRVSRVGGQDPATEIQKLGGADAAIALAVSARPFEQM